MRNAIEACKRANAKLIFFDNVYMYGKVNGPMTEETLFNPVSRKGEIRAQVATMLLEEIKGGGIQALIARSADFYGPGARTSVANILVFDKLAKREKASWLVNDSVPHSFTFTPDAARSLAVLGSSETSWNQTWHLPTALSPSAGSEFIRLAAAQFGVDPRYRVLTPLMLKLVGVFNSDVREPGEMLYQYDSPYVFDSTTPKPSASDQPRMRTASKRRH
jgi:nucleoside-diphosphate-sugar epimerase